MNAPRFATSRCVHVALLAVASVVGGRADDDVVTEDEPTPPPAGERGLGGIGQGGQVIIMPGLRLQVGGQGQLQLQGGVRVPAAGGNVRRQPFLGVVVSPVSPPVRAQLDLPEGVGLSIDAVEAGSPAEQAGVKRFDVIRTFNDQVLVTPEQLTTLVKVAGAGTRVPLAILRGGREQVVEAVLEEREVPVDEAAGFVQGMPGVLRLEQMVPPGFGAGGLGPQLQADIEQQLDQALARAGGAVHAQVLTIGPNAQSATVVTDARGTVEIRAANGKKTVTVKDPGGTEVYSGPLDADDDLEQVPEAYRAWVGEVAGVRPAGRPLAAEADETERESE